MIARNERSPRPSLLLAAALTLTAAAYAEAPRGGFVWDDRLLIERSALIQRGGSAAEFVLRPFWARSAEADALSVYYRPLTTLTYRLDQRVSAGNPSWFHLVNVLFHLGCVALVFLLGARAGGSPVAAALAAALFGLAPRLTESVAWISGRTDVLATLFALAAVALHRVGPRGALRRVAAAAAILLGLLCKEVAIAAPAAIAALVALRARRDGRRIRLGELARELAPASAAVAAYVALRVSALASARQFVDPSTLELSAGLRLASVAEALGRYPVMVVDALRPRLQIGQLGVPSVGFAALGVVLAAVAVALALRAWRRGVDPEVGAALAMAAAGISLVLHVVPFRVNIIAADRFLYLPVAALCIAAARAAPGWAPRARRAAAVAAIVAVPAFAAATWSRVQDWTDEERLWREAVRTTPASNHLPVHELANVLYRHGRYEEALPLYEEVLSRVRGRRDRYVAISNIASTLSELGRLDRARDLTLELVSAEPDLAVNRYNLAIIEARRLAFDEAERRLQEAVQLLPGYEDAQSAIPRVARLRAEWERLPAESPGEPAAIRARRAALYAELGRWADARRLYAATASAPDVTRDDAIAAAGYLLRRGPADQAAAAVARARALGADPAILEALAASASR